jgi:hypothetical protein
VFLLREPLTHYRLQGQNLFQSASDLNSIRRKHAVMVALAESLRARFDQERVPDDILDAVIDAVQIEADMLRLSLGEGSRWQNFRAELREYRLHHENASLEKTECLSEL